MAFLEDHKDIYALYEQAVDEARQWKEDYDEFERLADNEIMAGLDADLPEVNDGSLAAALFKLPKRIVSSSLTGRAKAVNRDDTWLTELANMQWEDKIVPNANSQAPFHRKWKDAVRKAAIYGGVPLITLFVERGDYTGADFIVGNPHDVRLEPGKQSDLDSDVLFWDVYLSESQLKDLIEQAKNETKEFEDTDDAYNKWDIKELERILASKAESERQSEDDHQKVEDKAVKRGGYLFCVVLQRGINAPFYMYFKGSQTPVREWANPDPTGDVPIHYLYCYQDMINPYGIGIVKLAGGTQNVLDYMRQSDVLATQLGLTPPLLISGNEDDVDLDSLVYARRAQWFVGEGQVTPYEQSNQVYQQLPSRISMYKTSLNQLIPTGDTSISAEAGDPQYSKTPAGVKFQAASLSIDDEDFKDNLYITYEQVAKSMINTHFANMQGEDLMRLSDEEKDVLQQAGVVIGEDSNELQFNWEEVRAQFDFEVEAEVDQEAEEKERLDGLLRVMELRAADPTFEQALMQSGKRLDLGELFSEIVKLTTDNEKIIQDIAPEDQAMMQQGMMGQEMMGAEQMAQDPMQDPMQASQQVPQQAPEGGMPPEEVVANVEAVMQEYGVDEQFAAAALDAEFRGVPVEEIVASLRGAGGAQ